MTNYPNSYDDDLSLPPVNDDIVEVGEEAIQAVRSAIFAIEEELGLGGSGTVGTVADRIAVSIDDAGLIKPSALTGIGLVSLPIFDSEVSATAAIQESKLSLTYSTQLLYNLFINLQDAIDILNNFLSITGIKIEPHVAGTNYRHLLSHIDVDLGAITRVEIEAGATGDRDLTNSYTFTAELSNDLLNHISADGISNVTTPPENRAHNASGIAIDASVFNVIPQSTDDLQSLAEYVDSNGLVLLGSRTQTLFGNGLPRSLRNTSLTNSAAGEHLVDSTPATTYLNSLVPDANDNYILLVPTGAPVSTSTVYAQMAQVRPGDYITVDYGNGSNPVKFTIDTVSASSVTIHGKNLFDSGSSIATVQIDRSLYHENRFNSLAIASALNNVSSQNASSPSVVIAQPSGASAVGIGFDPSQLNQGCYNLRLDLYPTGNPAEETVTMPVIDVTGNAGHTPGIYTLETVVAAMNRKFRDPSYNARFIAFAYKGELGIALADRYNGASFSIIAGTVDADLEWSTVVANSVIDQENGIDPLGFGLSKANIAGQPYTASYVSYTVAFNFPTIILSPLKRNYFYVNGVERDTLAGDILMTRDVFGDGYWPAVLTTQTNFSGKIEAVYEIGLDLTTSKLMVGKTLVVQPAVSLDSESYDISNYGRFIIKTVQFDVNCECSETGSRTLITVEDASHGAGDYPSGASPDATPNLPVLIYFGDDSASIADSATGFYEAYVKDDGTSFMHRRASWPGAQQSGSPNVEVIDISPKLLGIMDTGRVSTIALSLICTELVYHFNIFTGILGSGTPVTVRRGEITRIYDETGIDYIDIRMNLQGTPGTPADITLTLYPSLQFNQEHIYIGSYQQINGKLRTPIVNLTRQFGNITEKQLSTSALSYMTAPQRLLDENGIIRGFDLVSDTVLTDSNLISIKGGTAFVNGKIVEINDTSVRIPILKQVYSAAGGPPWGTSFITDTIRWYLCANSKNELEWVASSTYNREAFFPYLYDPLDGSINVINPRVAESAYIVRGGPFKSIVNSFKDVIPLYVVTSTVVDSGPDGYHVTTATIKDARRHTTDGQRGLAHRFSFGSTAAFRNVVALTTYLDEYINSSMDSQVVFALSDFLSDNLENKVYVTDIMDVSGMDLTFVPDYQFTEYTFANSSANNRVKDLGTKIIFIGAGGKFTVSTDPILVSHNVEFRDMTFDVWNDIGLKITGNNIHLDKCRINYHYDASTDGYFDDGYLGNVAKGCIFIDTSDSINKVNRNIKITHCKFYRDTAVAVDGGYVTNTIDYFPFITFIMSGVSSLLDDYYTGRLRHSLENILIDNNNFDVITEAHNYVGTAVESKRAVIVITSTVTDLSNNTIYFENHLINCKISNNKCNKNQMILMSAEEVDGELITAIRPINVSIDNNICGAICFYTRFHYQVDTATIFSTAALDKAESLVISHNTCKYIFCGTNKGLINAIGSTERIIHDGIFTTASTLIENNYCSWIHVGSARPPNDFGYEYYQGTPVLEINSNKLNAYLSDFLDDYHSGITPTNIALIIDDTVI